MNFVLWLGFLFSVLSLIKDLIDEKWKWKNTLLLSLIVPISTFIPLTVNLIVFLRSDSNKLKVIQVNFLKVVLLDAFEGVMHKWRCKGFLIYCNESSIYETRCYGGPCLLWYRSGGDYLNAFDPFRNYPGLVDQHYFQEPVLLRYQSNALTFAAQSLIRQLHHPKLALSSENEEDLCNIYMWTISGMSPRTIWYKDVVRYEKIYGAHLRVYCKNPQQAERFSSVLHLAEEFFDVHAGNWDSRNDVEEDLKEIRIHLGKTGFSWDFLGGVFSELSISISGSHNFIIGTLGIRFVFHGNQVTVWRIYKGKQFEGKTVQISFGESVLLLATLHYWSLNPNAGVADFNRSGQTDVSGGVRHVRVLRVDEILGILSVPDTLQVEDRPIGVYINDL